MNGDQIRRARERRGWTQKQLAAVVGVGYRTIGNWERGETMPRNKMGKIEKELGSELKVVEQEEDSIRDLSDLTLLAELMRRASARERGGVG